MRKLILVMLLAMPSAQSLIAYEEHTEPGYMPGQGIEVMCIDPTGRGSDMGIMGDSPTEEETIYAQDCTMPPGYIRAPW
jgi:hypothetical protein